MENVARWLPSVVGPVLSGMRRATKYVSPQLTVKATRRHRFSRRETRNEILVTIGVPNYLEQRFIRACRKAGEPFPVRRVQVKAYRAK